MTPITNTAEELAEAIPKAAGSSLKHYTPHSKERILAVAEKAIREQHEACAKIAERFTDHVVAAAIRGEG